MNKQGTILQSLRRIEQVIYWAPYDELTDYLKGIRDMINMLNGEENASEALDYILGQIAEKQLEYELPF